MPIKARGENARIVEDQQVPWVKQFRSVAERQITERAGVTIDAQHARACAICEWLLRNQIFGQVIIEVRDEHNLFYD